MVTREAIVEEARRWIGTRFCHQASLRGVGADCVGLISGVARALGIAEADAWASDPMARAYGRQPDPRALLTACRAYLDDALRPFELGDVLLMRFDVAPQHFGIVSALEPVYVIHSFCQARRVVEHRLDALWAARVLRTFRYRGIA